MVAWETEDRKPKLATRLLPYCVFFEIGPLLLKQASNSSNLPALPSQVLGLQGLLECIGGGGGLS